MICHALHEKIAKKIFIDAQNVKYVLSDTYFCPNSIKTENETVSTKKVTKKVRTTQFKCCRAK